MEPGTVNLGELGEISKRFARRLLTMGENRVELLMVEVQEERLGLLRAILLALGVAAFGLLAALAVTAALVVSLWAYSPLTVFLALATLYAALAVCFYRRLTVLLHGWQNFPATLDQLRKDRACLEKILD